jgi:hypothetical protein
MEHLMNKSPLMIKRMAKTMCEDDVREMIRYYFSRNLMDTSAENQMKVDIVMETDETFGLSTNDMLRIVSIWQHPSEGIITFVLNGGEEIDFDDIEISTLLKVMTDFNDLYIGEVD